MSNFQPGDRVVLVEEDVAAFVSVGVEGTYVNTSSDLGFEGYDYPDRSVVVWDRSTINIPNIEQHVLTANIRKV